MSITSYSYPTADVRRRATLSGNEKPQANSSDANAAYVDKKKASVFRKSFIILLVLLGLVHLAHDLTLKSKDWLRSEIREIVNEKDAIIETKLKNLYVTIDQIEESVEELNEKVKKENNKHDDGLERVDYALRSSEARVLEHSEVLPKSSGTNWLDRLFHSPNRVHPYANTMLTPSFNEPGHCLALKGTTGFVVIRLRRAIIPEAVTLEHLAKGVIPDEYRSSAPKDCQVSGWLQEEDSSSSVNPEKMFHLADFTYDLEKSSAQTFNVSESTASRVIDTVRLDVKSNHGRSSYTCIYRLKVHGQEPDSASITAVQN